MNGQTSAVVMNLKFGIDYKEDNSKIATGGIFQTSWLIGAAKEVYAYCLKNGLNPRIEWWADSRTNCGYALVADCDRPITDFHWTPSSEEIMKAVLLVLCDEQKAADALFIHALPATDDFHNGKALMAAATAYHSGMAKKLVINGLTAAESQKLNTAYQGCDVWMPILRNLGVAEEDLIFLPPSPHTAAESENLLKLARELSWKILTIMSMPHHQLRCFLQIVESMRKLGIAMRVYNSTFYSVDWAANITKPVMGGGTVTGTFMNHIEAELQRIIKYAQLWEIGYARHSTISEMMKYLSTR